MNRISSKIMLTAIARSLAALGATSLTYVLGGRLSTAEFTEFFSWFSWAMMLSLLIRFGGDKLLIKNILNRDEVAFDGVVRTQCLLTLAAVFTALLAYWMAQFSWGQFGFFMNHSVLLFSLLAMVAYYMVAMFIAAGATTRACLVQAGFVQVLAAIFIVVCPFNGLDGGDIQLLIIIIYGGIVGLAWRPAARAIKLWRWEKADDDSLPPTNSTAIWRSRLRYFIAGVGANFQAIGLYSAVALFLTDTDFLVFRYFERIAALASFIVVFTGVLLPGLVFRGQGTEFSPIVFRRLMFSVTISVGVSVLIGTGVFLSNKLYPGLYDVSISGSLLLLLISIHCAIAISSPLSFILIMSDFEQQVFKVQLCYLALTLISIYPSYAYGGLELMTASLLVMQSLRVVALISLPFLKNRKLSLQ